MKQEEEILAITLGIDYRTLLIRYEQDPVIKPLLDLCIRQLKANLELNKILYMQGVLK